MRKILSGVAVCLVSFAVVLATTTPATAQTGTEALVGEWAGELVNAQGVLVATISFELRGHRADTVHGNVELIMTGQEEPIEADRFAARTEHQERFDDLHVDFVGVAGGGVLGLISPYRSPNCGCAVSTTLSGTLSGDRIEGTTKGQHRGSGLEEAGTWWVARR